MRIIFLDIDGVLCTGRAMIGRPIGHVGGKYFDPIAMQILNRICKETEAEVVVSSTWRFDNSCREILRCVGFSGKFFGNTDQSWRTPYNPQGSRGKQIEAWIIMNYRDNFQGWTDTSQIEELEYVILDDDSDMLEHQLPRFVKIDHDVGLNVKDYFKIKELFGIPETLIT